MASDPARHLYAVIRLNPTPPNSLVTGYVYSTAADAQAEATAGLPWGSEVLGQPVRVIRGSVTYTDPHESRHVNRLAVSLQYSADAQGKTWASAFAGEGNFDWEGLLRVEYNADEPVTLPTWSPWSPPVK